MDLSFYLYLFMSIAIIAGGSYTFFKGNQTIAGAIFLVGSIALTILFGTRWFLPSGVSKKDGQWPPVINVCPDFLTLTTVNKGTDDAPILEKVCIDTIGVASSSDGINKCVPANGCTDEKYLFHLFAGDPARVKKLCDQCSEKKVTWEGIYDPSGSCSGIAPPSPPV